MSLFERIFRLSLHVAGVLLLTGLPAAAQPWDMGDAPEGQAAYPSLGVGGLFPTCLGGPAGFVQHAPNLPGFQAYFGPSVDYEPEGNAGFCPPPPYERDECWHALDNDAGIVFPTPWTIHQNQELPCGQLPPSTLGQPCSLASWGPGGVIDIRVVNETALDLVVNVLADWNQDGQWGGFAACPQGGAFSEHVVQNLPVPPFFTGNLSALGAPQFRVGPNAGFVWFRFTISEQPGVPLGWDGARAVPFDVGETEDYLLLVGDYTVPPGEPTDATALALPEAPARHTLPTAASPGSSRVACRAAPPRLIKGRGVAVSIDTNGTLLAHHAEDIARIGVDNLNVSVDGPESVIPTGGVLREDLTPKPAFSRLTALRKRLVNHPAK